MRPKEDSLSLVCIVILNWNGKHILRRCLESVFSRTSYPTFEVIVVDNSTDGSVDMCFQEFPTAKLIVNETNLGFAGGNNRGLELAVKRGAEYVILLNNDIEVIEDDWLTKIIRIAEANPEIGLLGPRLVDPDGTPQDSVVVAGSYGMLGTTVLPANRTSSPLSVLVVRGSALLIRASVISVIGFLDEDYDTAFFEDEDYCFRVRRAGYNIMYYPDAALMHLRSATTSKLPKFRYVFVGYRNMFRFAILNLTGTWLISCFVWLILSAVFAKKNSHLPIWFTNLTFREDLGLHIKALLTALYTGLVALPALLRLRSKRLSFS